MYFMLTQIVRALIACLMLKRRKGEVRGVNMGQKGEGGDLTCVHMWWVSLLECPPHP